MSSFLFGFVAVPATVLALLVSPFVFFASLLLKNAFEVRFTTHRPSETAKEGAKKLLILVTGTSTGIGRDAAISLAQIGFHVFATVRKEADGVQFSKLENLRGSITPIIVDVTDNDSRVKAFDKIETEISGSKNAQFVGLVNNAGLSDTQLAENLDSAYIRTLFEVNVFSIMELTKLFLPLLRQSKGRIINISSFSGKIAAPLGSLYSASKFALEGYTDSLRREVSQLGVSVSLLEPGVLQSEITNHSASEVLETLSNKHEVKKAYDEVLKKGIKSWDAAYKVKLLPKKTTTPAIVHALTSAYPKTRYPVAKMSGTPVWFLTFLASVLPDRMLDHMTING